MLNITYISTKCDFDYLCFSAHIEKKISKKRRRVLDDDDDDDDDQRGNEQHLKISS